MYCLQLTIFKVMLHRSNQLCPRRQQTAVQQWKCTRGALPPPPAVTACTTRPSFVARPPKRAVGVFLSPCLCVLCLGYLTVPRKWQFFSVTLVDICQSAYGSDTITPTDDSLIFVLFGDFCPRMREVLAIGAMDKNANVTPLVMSSQPGYLELSPEQEKRLIRTEPIEQFYEVEDQPFAR